jgi:hypothetical protein
LSTTRTYRQAKGPSGPDGCQNLVLYQAIMQRIRPSVQPVVHHQKLPFSGSENYRLQDLHPDIQRLFQNLHRRIFVQNDWWSAVYTEKGMVVDTFV